MTAEKQTVLCGVMDEYSNLVNIFIGIFWAKDLTLKDLTKEITNIPESWLSARMRQCAAREALGMVNGASKKAKQREEEPILPVHTGKKMTLSPSEWTNTPSQRAIPSFWKKHLHNPLMGFPLSKSLSTARLNGFQRDLSVPRLPNGDFQ